MNEVEQLVIKNLLLDEEYVRKAMPFIRQSILQTLQVRNYLIFYLNTLQSTVPYLQKKH